MAMPVEDPDTTPSPDRDIRTVPPNVDPTRTTPRAAAVRIGTRDLWIGNEGAANPAHLETLGIAPSHVVTLTRRPTEATTDHYPLDDARVNDQTTFTAAVETTRTHYRNDESQLVHCAAGISRSATVIATALAAEEDRAFGAGVDIVQAHRRRAHPHPKLRVNALSYLTTDCNRRQAWETLRENADQITLARTDDKSVLDPVDTAPPTRTPDADNRGEWDA
jgi:atypical dual specificity phosphatase